MKKTIKLTLAVVFVMGATSLFAQKFGRINTQEVISVMPEMKEMQTNIEAYSKDLQESMENIVVEYNNKYQEFNKNFSTMSDAVRQLKEKELNDLIQRRNDFEQVAQQDLQKRYNELLAPIIDKAKAAIDKVATAALPGSFDFDRVAGLFRRGHADRPRLAVKKELGITDAPAATPAAPAAPAAK
ncbi:MAG: OmpH family outer membrane protein [Alistipes putredinis]